MHSDANRCKKTSYRDIWYESQDGLRLYARDYNNCTDSNPPTLLCLHGLTRNSADFEDICAVLGGRYRLIVADQRGRGLSQFDSNADNYTPLTYVGDMFRLLDTLGTSSVILMGTSLGGIMAMMMAAMKPELVSGLIINDIGPDIAEEGLDRIRRYVGKTEAVTNWQQAVAQMKVINGQVFPEFSDQDWLAFAKRCYVEGQDGRPVLAYDANITKPINNEESGAIAPDLWPLYDSIKSLPMLSIRGELSDLFTAECQNEMQQRNANLQTTVIANVGHAPILNEPQAISAIESFLAEG